MFSLFCPIILLILFLLVCNNSILLCFFFLFLVNFNNLFIIPVVKENARLKLAPFIPTGAPIMLNK